MKAELNQKEVSYLLDILNYQQENMFYTKDISWKDLEEYSQGWHDKKNLSVVGELISKLTLKQD